MLKDNKVTFLTLLAVSFTCCWLPACGSSSNTSESSPLGSDQGEYIHFINNTDDDWWVSYGSGSHSNQYTIDGQSATKSLVLKNGENAYLGWQGSRTNPWSQNFNIGGLSQLNIYGHNNNPHCANEIVDPTQSGDIWICPDDKYTVNAAVQYMPAPGHQGYGYWGYVEFRNKFVFPSYQEWLSGVPDSVVIGDLNIAGSHDTATKNCPQTSKAQDMGFRDQMEWGARAFDLRLSETMHFWHGENTGKCYCGYTLYDFLDAAFAFLGDHPREFLIALVKAENCSGTTEFATSFDAAVNHYGRNKFIIDKNILNMTLVDLRGKVIIVTRKTDSGKCGYVTGAPQIDWPNDTSQYPTSTSGCDSCIPVGISDNYSDWPRTKMGHGGLLEHFYKASTDEESSWFIGFTSGYDLGGSCLCTPVDYAQAINPAIWEYLVGGDGYVNKTCGTQNDKATGWINTIPPTHPGGLQRSRKLGTVMMDFLGSYNTNDIRNDLIRRNYEWY
jgi:hypothetical protein